jgi:putative transposase
MQQSNLNCVIPKVFYLDERIRGMKLTKTKLLETLRSLNNGNSKYQARKIASISKQRVYQVWKIYNETNRIPEIGKNTGRPIKIVEDWEVQIVKDTYEKYRVSADTLERIIKRDYDKHFPHNRIHKILLMLGFAEKKDKKDIRKKNWIRYERRHSLTAVHIDWHYCSKTQVWIFAVIDDASRKILALLECEHATLENSITGMLEALKHGKILQCISDHGAQFVTNHENGKSLFTEFLVKHEILQILCRIKHPQSNGKIEKWFNIYDDHRFAFQTKEEFLQWYNETRPHRSLNFAELETPQQAFIRKMKTEA